jgi:hypothetical protein
MKVESATNNYLTSLKRLTSTFIRKPSVLTLLVPTCNMPYRLSDHQTPTRSSSNVYNARQDRDRPLQLEGPITHKQQIKSRTSSLQISCNLLSLISRFEALDSLSSPHKITSSRPRPATLGDSKNSWEPKPNKKQQKNVDPVFSPISGNRGESRASLDGLAAAKDDIPVSPKTSSKNSSAGRLRQTKSSQKDISLRLRKIQADNGVRRNTVQDKIKFFDGSTEAVAAAGRSHHQRNSPPRR